MKGIIDTEFVVLSPDKVASIEAKDSTLYQRLVTDYDGFRGHELISCHEFDEDWSSWEIHPHGDEIVILLSGEVRFFFANR
jgi:mannose-6-phosphate isomerase-like protein (cupin superfamily)